MTDENVFLTDLCRRLFSCNVMMLRPDGKDLEAFEEKYLTDMVDRVVYEYVRGYGQTELAGGAMGLLSIMTEKSADIILEHIDALSDKGLIYPVAGKTGWYGADYPFADD